MLKLASEVFYELRVRGNHFHVGHAFLLELVSANLTNKMLFIKDPLLFIGQSVQSLEIDDAFGRERLNLLSDSGLNRLFLFAKSQGSTHEIAHNRAQIVKVFNKPGELVFSSLAQTWIEAAPHVAKLLAIDPVLSCYSHKPHQRHVNPAVMLGTFSNTGWAKNSELKNIFYSLSSDLRYKNRDIYFSDLARESLNPFLDEKRSLGTPKGYRPFV